MLNPLNPIDWLKATQDWFAKTERSSGFRPILICIVACFGFAGILLFHFPDSALIQIFAICLVAFPVVGFVITYIIKAFTQPDFCRSERHVQRMRQIEMEQMGTDQRQIDAREVESEPRIPKIFKEIGSRARTARREKQAARYEKERVILAAT